MSHLLSLIVSLGVALMAPLPSAAQDSVLLEDFESYESIFPERWRYVTSEGEKWNVRRVFDGHELFTIHKEGRNQFLRGYTLNESQRITLINGDEYDWNVEKHPFLSWRWRAVELPEGANEKKKNDAGGAVYVTFDTDWLGRPKSIKYTYSSTLPVGTVVSFGPLKVIVASSGEDGYGGWKSIERDVIADYKRVFGGTPPERPLSITLWSDSDDTETQAKVDFDDLTVHRSAALSRR